MGTWEHKNIARSPPPHNSLGIFCWGEIPQNTKRNKKRGFYEQKKESKSETEEEEKEKVLFRPFSGEFVKGRSGRAPV